MHHKDKSESLNIRFPRITSSEHAKEIINKAKQEAEKADSYTFVVHTLSQSQNDVSRYSAEVFMATHGRAQLKVNGNMCSFSNLLAVMVGAWLELSEK